MNLHEIEAHSPGDWFYDVHDQLKRHIVRRSERAFAEGDAARDAVRTREQLEARQQAARQCLLDGIGGLPESDTPLEAQVVGTLQEDGFRIEKVIFQSRPRHYVTANLYLPDDLGGPTGAALFLCGHHMQAKHQPEYQIVCRHLAQAGLIVLAQDPIGQGERFGYHEPAFGGSTVTWGTREHDHAGAQCLPLGDGLARYFLHDAMRGVDYLRSRPEVDPDRIGVTGNSGGGTQSSLMMLADTRIAAAAPGTFIMSRQSYLDAGGAQDAEQIWPGFSEAGFDHEDILLAMAPRPVRVLAVTGDFFPIEGTRRTVERCKRLWALCGREGDLDLVEDESDHAYTPALARAAAKFFARHLLGRDVAPDSGRIQPVEPSRLWCTQSGQARGELAGADFVYEANQARLKEAEQARQAIPEAQRRARALEWLREKVHRGRAHCDLNPRFILSSTWEACRVQSALWRAQEGIFNYGVLFRHFRFDGQALPVTLAVWDGGASALRPHSDWLRQTCESGRAVLVLDVSGVGALLPRAITRSEPRAFYGVLHKFATDLLWLDDDLPSLRAFDALCALDMIAAWPGLDASDIAVYAHGRQGLYGRLAAALDARVRRVEVAGGFRSYADFVAARHYDTDDIYSVLLRGILRAADLPDLEDGRFRHTPGA